MKRKALLCVILALALFLSAQPAAALTSNQFSTEIEALMRVPVIEVIVPSSANVLINPLEMPVWIGGIDTNEQIICYPDYLLSLSEVPLKVDVQVTGSVYPNSDLTLANSSTGGTGTAKRAFIYFEMQQSSSEYWEDVRWDAGFNALKHIPVRENTSTSKPGMVTLPSLTPDGELPENAYAWFRVAGDAVKEPTNPWNENDGICVTVAYTFTPLSYGST